MLLYVGGEGYKQFKENNMKFQDWFTQEYLSWAKEGKPDGWTNEEGKDIVDMGIIKCDVDVMFHNKNKEILTFSLKTIPTGGEV
ncbi:hypothetical protein LCGC14_0514320 [marine sediment metagenome]|uniref:Uncharacterized protein n=1 Tax=marine sediment metagenome TaxID=412755 RepID=A0A0F9V8E8_9ZZZZ